MDNCNDNGNPNQPHGTYTYYTMMDGIHLRNGTSSKMKIPKLGELLLIYRSIRKLGELKIMSLIYKMHVQLIVSLILFLRELSRF